MKKQLTTLTVALLLLGCSLSEISAQSLDCNFKAPVLKIDFTNEGKDPDINIGYLSNYRKVDYSCPPDGNYAFVSSTSGCFNNDWITLNEDHTSGDYKGRMMLVNASETPGLFFQYAIGNLTAGSVYEFSAWIVNVCRTTSPCNPTPPRISFTIQSAGGSQIAKFNTGTISPTDGANWQRYYGEFTLPAGNSGVIIRMNDETIGGCGNDFALDDIMLRECMLHKPEKKETPKPVVTPPAVIIPKPVVKKSPPAAFPSPTKNISTFDKEEVSGKPVRPKPSIKSSANKLPIPDVLLTRSNPVVKQIETPATEMLIELYDNGEIDGDTVTIYHNNAMVKSRAALSEKPVSFKIKVDRANPHHELVMVANNLGAIPPNTSLMVITANDKRYEVFISSSEQKNARVVIDLKEE